MSIPDPESAPAIPEKVRTVVYVVSLVVGAITLAGPPAVAAISPDLAGPVSAVAGAIATVVATIAGGLGVAYRPTRQRS